MWSLCYLHITAFSNCLHFVQRFQPFWKWGYKMGKKINALAGKSSVRVNTKNITNNNFPCVQGLVCQIELNNELTTGGKIFLSDWYTKYPAYMAEQIPGCLPSWRGSLSCQLEHWTVAGLEALKGTLAGWKIGWLVAEDRWDQLEKEKLAWDWKCHKICNVRINII